MSMAFRAGDSLGPYQVQHLIGRGSFGMVLLASDLRSARQTALKIVPCDHLDSEAASKAREAALSEAGMLKRLLHPNIVTCYEMCWDSERAIVWLALEYMDGGDIQGVLTSRRAAGEDPFDALFLRKVLVAIGSALRFVHRQSILHRDVKPGNMLLQRNAGQPTLDQIKLADFGIAKLLEAAGSARTVVGTPLYMAPEMVSGRAYAAAGDAWALGICLYELATLHRPFEAGNQLALARQIVDEPPPPLPEALPSDLRDSIMGLLEKDESQRMNLGQALRLSPEIRQLMEDGVACSGIDALEELPSACSTPRAPSTSGGSTYVESTASLVQGVIPKLPVALGAYGTSSLVSPGRLLRGGTRSPLGVTRPTDGPAPQKEKKEKTGRMWFSWMRPSRSKETSVSSDCETVESTTAVSAFSYPEDLDDSPDGEEAGKPKISPHAVTAHSDEPERHHTMKAWQ